MNEDRYKEALDAIRDAQGDQWFAYSGPDIETAEEQANRATDTKIAKITLPVVHRKWPPLLHVCIDGLRGDHAIDEMAEFIVLFEDAVIELAEFVSEEDRDGY